MALKTTLPIRVPRRKAAANYCGFSLMEMILVLALLMIVAALVMPPVVGSFGGQNLKDSAFLLQSELLRARTTAMRSGQTQIFRYEISGRMAEIEALEAGVKYVIQPWRDLSDLVNASPETIQQDSSTNATIQSVDEITTGELPEGIAFVSSSVVSDTRSTEVERKMHERATSATIWSQPILFYPDGRSSTAQVVLGNQRDQFIVIELRGLTGLAKVSDLLAGNEVPQ